MVCVRCHKWLRGISKIQANDTNYCVGCFASELRTCPFYLVLNHGSFELMGDGWPAREELLLLTAIERYSLADA
jgi:hypothetical protein